LWVDGVDQAGTCVRLPGSNSPVTDPTSQDLACNAGGSTGVAGMCAVTDPNAAKWFKVAEEGYDVATKVWADTTLNENCGKKDFTVPADLATGDYLVRAEIIALHTAGSAGGAQFYMSCYQIHVEGTGSASPAGVSFPGAYSATDPGILINIYATIDEYVIPGPELYGAAAVAPAAPAAPATPTASTAAAASSSTVVRAAASSKAPTAPASKSTAAPVATATTPVAADPADECE
ncbi:glycosyl hydrolase family 61, partial [Diplocarpon rosae]